MKKLLYLLLILAVGQVFGEYTYLCGENGRFPLFLKHESAYQKDYIEWTENLTENEFLLSADFNFTITVDESNSHINVYKTLTGEKIHSKVYRDYAYFNNIMYSNGNLYYTLLNDGSRASDMIYCNSEPVFNGYKRLYISGYFVSDGLLYIHLTPSYYSKKDGILIYYKDGKVTEIEKADDFFVNKRKNTVFFTKGDSVFRFDAGKLMPTKIMDYESQLWFSRIDVGDSGFVMYKKREKPGLNSLIMGKKEYEMVPFFFNLSSDLEVDYQKELKGYGTIFDFMESSLDFVTFLNEIEAARQQTLLSAAE